jgi:Leucine-rich repeat (LRR) protein
MRCSLLAYVFLLAACRLGAQGDDPKKTPFDTYGPYGVFVYNDLKEALKDEDKVYKMNLSYKPIEPKLWPKITKLKNMQALNLQSVSVNTWPPDFTASLRNLVYLASYNNEFKAFPEKMGALTNLMYLEIINSKIDSIPSEIAYLQKLKIFKFSSNNDTLKLPKSLKYMKSLNDFVVESAILDSMPKSIFSISTLKMLVLANCSVQAMPERLDKMSNLEVLVLDYNKLTALPRDIYKCRNLFYLSLKKNQISKIPDTICHLKNLSTLDLRENPIAADKDAIEELKILLPGCKILI